MSTSILVTGGTGNVGQPVVRGLLAKGLVPKVMLRNMGKAATLPAGATAVAGDLEKPETLAGAFAGVDRLFLLTSLAEDETEQGLAAVAAAKQAGVRRVVYMTVHQVDTTPHIPHFASKVPVKKAIADSGMECTFIEPNNFYQVDAWFQQAITGYGVYPQPIGSKGTNRVDTRDIADAIVNALVENSDVHNGVSYPLIGPDVWTGDGVAAVWSKHLGRDVHYGGNDLDAWAAQSRQYMPGWLVDDLRIMYDHFQQHGLLASAAEFALQAKVLGHEPRGLESFVAETAATWKAQAAGA